jgi:bacterioferritin-associated ferredoxin
MMICHCLLLNDRAILDASAGCPATVEAVAEACGAGSMCGGCRDAIEATLSEGRRLADEALAMG